MNIIILERLGLLPKSEEPGKKKKKQKKGGKK